MPVGWCLKECDSRQFFGEAHDASHADGACPCPCHAPQARRCEACPTPHTWERVGGAELPDDPSAPVAICPGAVNRAIEAAAVTGWLNERERARLRGVEMIEKCFAIVGGEEEALENYDWEIINDHPTLKGPVPTCRARGGPYR